MRLYVFERLRTFLKTLDVFGNLRKWTCRLQKSQHSQDKNVTPTSQKKLAGRICPVHLEMLGFPIGECLLHVNTGIFLLGLKLCRESHGIWQDAAMRIRIIHWNPHLPHNSDIFRIIPIFSAKKQKKYLILVIKQLLNILKNVKAEEIDCFETLIFLNIEENTPFRSQDESS